MKLSFIECEGFRGYRKQFRIDFADGFTIIDGRNGVGKSTIFDALEFALTGALGKYGEQRASGETFADYVWWRGAGPAPSARYVTVGFRDDGGPITITRREFQTPEPGELRQLLERLCDSAVCPAEPLTQLCTSAIIRDEQITNLSLDLKETDRYVLLRDALGANDSDAWIGRGGRLVSAAHRRVNEISGEVAKANDEVATAARQLDEVRARVVSDTVIAAAAARLRKFAGTDAGADELIGRVREHLASTQKHVEALTSLTRQWAATQTQRERLGELSSRAAAATFDIEKATAAAQSLGPTPPAQSASALAAEARQLIELVSRGRAMGLRDGHCPLCWQQQIDDQFQRGMENVEALARRLDAHAAAAAKHEESRRKAAAALAAAQQAAQQAEAAHASAQAFIAAYDKQLQDNGLAVGSSVDQIRTREAELRSSLTAAQNDLRILETLHLNAELDRALANEAESKGRLARAQERLSRARKAEATAQALHDASRRAAAETLDQRLERVLPLMSELYRRLRPHPIWNDIEYSIRGDVRRFLRLQVGDELNPQFLFSSGQRRATGLAFLLSVNLSLAWSRLHTVLLDDPVQHIDDYRAIHPAELLAQLVSDGRQVICAVEDAALADLLCRRLPVSEPGSGLRVTLGIDDEGALCKHKDQRLVPLTRNALTAATDQQSSTAG